MDINAIIQTLSVMALPLLLGVTLHEAGHAYAAYYLGDDTAAKAGRLSLNPLVHIDPVGTLLMPGFLLLMGAPFLFGYAKPVPVNVGRLRNPRRDDIIVSLAGPAGNIIVALVGAIALKVSTSMGFTAEDWIVQTSYYTVMFNCLLAVFNLLPIPPLDGGRVLQAILPYSQAQALGQVERFGFFIVIGIIVFIPAVVKVPLEILMTLILSVVGV